MSTSNKGDQALIILLQFSYGILLLVDKIDAPPPPPPRHTEVRCVLQNTDPNQPADRGEKIFCSRESSDAEHPIEPLPLNATYPEDIKEIEVANLGQGLSNKWSLNNHTMFHRFINLEKLIIRSSPVISHEYDEGKNKMTLENELFNLSKLADIELQFWRRKEFTWKLPEGLRSLRFTDCGYTSYDLNATPFPNLTFVDFSNCQLQSAPKFWSPAPPVKGLWLQGMQDLDFSVLDIVQLCSLNDIRVYDKKTFITNTKRYCECNRLGQYTREFNFETNIEFQCDPDNRKKRFSRNCQEYPAEEAMLQHRKACNLLPPSTPEPPSTAPPTHEPTPTIFPTLEPTTPPTILPTPEPTTPPTTLPPPRPTTPVRTTSTLRPTTPPKPKTSRKTTRPPRPQPEPPCPSTSCQSFIIIDIVLVLALLLIDLPLCIIYKNKIFIARKVID